MLAASAARDYASLGHDPWMPWARLARAFAAFLDAAPENAAGIELVAADPPDLAIQTAAFVAATGGPARDAACAAAREAERRLTSEERIGRLAVISADEALAMTSGSVPAARRPGAVEGRTS
jgi:hypothetical protein